MGEERPMQRTHAHLFTVRVWEEEIGIDLREWRGQVQLLTTGETRYFREWSGLAPLLITLLTNLDTDGKM